MGKVGRRSGRIPAPDEPQKTEKVEHYLLTLQIAANNYMHAYVVTDDKRQIEVVTEMMMEKAEAMKCRPLPMVLCTRLSTGVDLVRRIVSELDEEAKRLLEKPPDSHVTIFAMEANQADNKRLMELH